MNRITFSTRNKNFARALNTLNYKERVRVPADTKPLTVRRFLSYGNRWEELFKLKEGELLRLKPLKINAKWR